MTQTANRAARLSTTDRRAVASYDRISKLKEDVGAQPVELTVGTDRQYQDNQSAAVEFGLGGIDRRYTDPDQSASEFRTKEREDFPRLLRDIEAGEIGVVIGWVMDRIIRDGEDQERFFRLCRQHNVRLIQSGPMKELDLNDPDSLTMARIQGALAIGETLKMSMRMRRRNEAAAHDGLPHGNRRFGYGGTVLDEHGRTVKLDRCTINPVEGPIFRDLVTRFLAGESLYMLAKGLMEREVKTAAGRSKWTGPNLRDMLLNPAYAGWRVHKGTIVGKGRWPALIPEETHDHLVATLKDPARRPKGAGNARVWLLPGVAVCDECGGGVRIHHDPREDRRHKKAYACRTGAHFHRPQDAVDFVVETAVVDRLSRTDATGLFQDDTAAEEVIRLRAARRALGQRYQDYVDAADTMSPTAYGRATGKLEAQMATLDSQIKAAQSQVRMASRVLDGATGPDAALVWYGPGGPDGDRVGGLPLARRRAIIAELCEVRIRGGRNGNAWNPEDVIVRWR